jgi:3-phenylpropionate/cinnamic acid dioxygenase small subunit
VSTKATKVTPELQLEIEQYYYREAELLDDHLASEAFAMLSRLAISSTTPQQLRCRVAVYVRQQPPTR